MPVTIDLVEGKAGVTAHATVTNTDGMKVKKGVRVSFRVDGKSACKPVVTEAGIASVELALKPGDHNVEATWVGTGQSDSEDITVAEHVPVTGPMGWAIMLAYWIAEIKFGYGRLAVMALLVTTLVLFLRAKLEESNGEGDWREMFLGRLLGNNWVFKTAAFLAVITGILWWIDPTIKPLNPIYAMVESVKNVVRPPMEDPLGRKGFWATINPFLLGEGGTWRGACGSAVLWTILAIPVSYWDEFNSWMFKSKKEESGMRAWLTKHLQYDVIEKAIKMALGFK